MPPHERLLRIARLAAHLCHGILVLSLRFPRMSRAQQQAAIRRWSARLLRIVGVRLVLSGPQVGAHVGAHVPPGQPGMMLAINHVSWLDVFAVLSALPARFVAKSEIAAWPLLGGLVRASGTIFIRRGSRRHAAQTSGVIREALHAGDLIAICPEGTTTEGDRLLPFHAALFQPAVEAGAIVQPIALRYADRAGQPTAVPAYVGELSLLASLWRVLGERGLSVSLVLAEPIAAAGGDRLSVSRAAEQAIARALGVRPPPRGAPRTERRPPAAGR